MATLRDIRRRIRSVKSTQQITRAMKMIAASKLRRAQVRLFAMRPYAQSLGGALRRFLDEATSEEHPLLQEREAKTVAAVVFTGDRGLCGAFNGNLIREALAFSRENSGRNPRFVAIGKKGADFFRRKAFDLLDAYIHIAEVVTLRGAAQITHKIIRSYLEGTIDEVHLIHSSFASTLSHPIVRYKLLPFDPEAMPKPEGEETSHTFIYEPSHEGICEEIFTSYLVSRVYLAFLESMASEYASRMTSMDAATQNADDMIERLTMDYNRARQKAITREILDIVGGAEALR